MADEGSAPEQPAPDEGIGEAAAKLDRLTQYLDASIKDMGAKRKRNQRLASILKLASLILSAAATFVLALGDDRTLQVIALACTASLTVLNAVDPYFNFRALWIEHEHAKSQFFSLYDRVRFYAEGRAGADVDMKVVMGFYGEYEEIWENLGEAWDRARRTTVSAGSSASGRPRSSSTTRSGCSRRPSTPCSTTAAVAAPSRGRATAR